MTKSIFGREEAAERLLRAVADGAPESVELARELVAAVLVDDTVRRAVQLDELLRQGSPLALVRAVELAAALHARAVDNPNRLPAHSSVRAAATRV